MKSLHIGNVAGQMNLRGKRSKMLRCGRCEVQDFRQRESAREARKEMGAARNAMVERYLDAHPWMAQDFDEDAYETAVIDWYRNSETRT